MRDHAAADRWDEASKVAALAAPFVHPRLAAVDLKADVGVTAYDVSDKPLTADEWSGQVAGRPH